MSWIFFSSYETQSAYQICTSRRAALYAICYHMGILYMSYSIIHSRHVQRQCDHADILQLCISKANQVLTVLINKGMQKNRINHSTHCALAAHFVNNANCAHFNTFWATFVRQSNDTEYIFLTSHKLKFVQWCQNIKRMDQEISKGFHSTLLYFPESWKRCEHHLPIHVEMIYLSLIWIQIETL